MIREFQREYRFLSNFYPATVELDGVQYPTVEHAYQAAKVLSDDPRRKEFQRAVRPGDAKRLGRVVRLRDDWERVKVDVMRDLLRQKFAPGTQLAGRLLATGNQELVEGNTWGDTFWGVCGGFGQNWLGILLMGIRRDLQND